MIVGSLPFVHYLSITKNGWKNLINDVQVKWFFIIVIILVFLVTLNLFFDGKTFMESLIVVI